MCWEVGMANMRVREWMLHADAKVGASFLDVDGSVASWCNYSDLTYACKLIFIRYLPTINYTFQFSKIHYYF